jgi:predicted nucleic acid-binding protein
VRIRRISEKAAYDAIAWFGDLGIPVSSTAHLLENAITIALALDTTVYDALYVALAIASGRSLITADERLGRAAGARYPVRSLASFA